MHAHVSFDGQARGKVEDVDARDLDHLGQLTELCSDVLFDHMVRARLGEPRGLQRARDVVRRRIHVHEHLRDLGYLLEHGEPRLLREAMGGRGRETRVDPDGEVDERRAPHRARAHLVHVLDTHDGARRVARRLHHAIVRRVGELREGLEADPEAHPCDHEADEQAS